ncbi:MAG TPA: cation:proton antiporter [Rhodothermales bacterium]
METLSPHQITVMFLSLGVLLGAARILGEIAHKLHQPAIVGELLAGVLLGPTVLGNIAPEFMALLFPLEGPNAIGLNAITNLGVVLFLLVAGMEIDLSIVTKQGTVAPKISVSGICIPFLLGFLAAWLAPRAMGYHPGADSLTFAQFFATAMSISALPVIAKTLMDLGLYRSDRGMVIMSAAIVDDLIGWIIFALILGMMDVGGDGHPSNIGLTIGLTLLFAATMLTLGRWLIHRTLPFLQAYTRWPGGVLGFALTLALLGAAFTEWIGIHAIFGSFLVGVAIGDSSHLRERTRVNIDNFISFIFAPLFFASIGLKVDFLAHFDAFLVLAVLVIACVCKLGGGYVGARWGRMSVREAWAVGFAMNSRGAMEIILGLLALEAGIIGDRLFVALVIMAIVTSMISGPGMRAILRPTTRRRFQDFLSAKHLIRELQVVSRREAIRELVERAAETTGLDVDALDTAVWEREDALSTGVGNGLALPHARIDGIQDSVVVAGISHLGVDFDAPDGRPVHVIFLLLTPTNEPTAQLEFASEIVRLFRNPRFLDRVLRVRNFADFLALMNSVPFDYAND